MIRRPFTLSASVKSGILAGGHPAVLPDPKSHTFKVRFNGITFETEPARIVFLLDDEEVAYANVPGFRFGDAFTFKSDVIEATYLCKVT